MHRVKHGPMDPCFFLPFFGPIGEGKAPWGRGCPVSPCVPCVFCVPYVPCVPCVPCLVCPVSLVSPVSLVFPVSRCVPCVPCLVCPVSPYPLCPFCHFKKMKCSVALPLFHVACGEKTSMVFFAFIWQHAGFFFARSGGQRMWFFMKIESKNTKFCLTCLKDNLFNF